MFKIIKNRFPDKSLQYSKKQGSQIKGVTYHEGLMKGEGADRFPVSGEKKSHPGRYQQRDDLVFLYFHD